MRAKIFFTASFLIIALAVAACKTDPSSAGDKVIKSTRSGDMTIAIASATGDLKVGDNDLMLSFTDASGNLIDVGSASLTFHMPAMGAMAEMNDKAELTTTDTPGKYRAQVKVEMTGTWEARIVYQGSRGNGQATMSVQAK
ncbi:MAG: FixH family protein [Acidobacteriota bacterium]